jgi:hypothetical protein
LTLNGNPIESSQWSNNGDSIFITQSNVGIGLSNPAYPLDVHGTVNASSNIFAQGGVVTTLVAANLNALNYVGTNALIDTLSINNSILFNNQLNNQIINTILKSGVGQQNISVTISWQYENLTLTNNTLLIQLTHDVSTLTTQGFRVQNIKVQTLSPVTVLSDSSAVGQGDISAYTSLTISSSVTSTSVTFTSTTSINTADITLHSVNITLSLIPPSLGVIQLS